MDLKQYAKDLEESFYEYVLSNEWGSGEDRIEITDKIERDYFEGVMFDDGLTKEQTEEVLRLMGFSV